jgi:hypothetical protein
VSAGVLSERSRPALPSQSEQTRVLGVKLVDGALFLEDDRQVRDDRASLDERRKA